MQYYTRSKYETEENGPYIESALYFDIERDLSFDDLVCRMYMLVSSGRFSLEEYKLIFKNLYLPNLEMWFKEDSENIREKMLTRKIWYF